MKKIILCASCFLITGGIPAFSQGSNDNLSPLITDIPNRHTVTLDGRWHYIVDPYQTGYIDYRYHPTARGFFQNRQASDPSDLVEYNFERSPELRVPGDWNTQKDRLLYYEGTLWYEKTFTWHKQEGRRVFLYFGAVNYNAVVGMNGKILGEHTGGFTPFDFEVTGLLKEGRNFIVVKVNNQRHLDGVPTNNFDWWNYGGITRGVCLVETPATFIRDYFIHLSDLKKGKVNGWVQLDGPDNGGQVSLQIPGLKKTLTLQADRSGRAAFSFEEKRLELWQPDRPKLYDILITAGGDTLRDQAGFRTIAVRGQDILLNGRPVFLKGVCIHEEAPFGGGRAHSAEQDRILLGWAREMGCNFVRLAHYPHNEAMIREAEKMGILVWSEIPVYWTIDWTNDSTLRNAENQLTEEITRDKNRANIILWSVGNETPRTGERLKFMTALVRRARTLDSTRLITAALQISSDKHHISMLDDPLGQYLDVLGCNVYPGWYGPSPAPDQSFQTPYDKPLIMSEFGAGALQGFHGSADERWTEEFQDRVIRDDIAMLKRIPFLRGTTPWILKDFRSPKRLLPGVQEGWNLKGLVSDDGIKKEAFYTIRDFYRTVKEGY